jgi:hypothetical protein
VNIQEFQKNRSAFPHAELLKHKGKWVAFSSDGRRIVASHEELGTLNDLVVAAGEDPEQVGFERVLAEDIYLGAAELW